MAPLFLSLYCSPSLMFYFLAPFIYPSRLPMNKKRTFFIVFSRASNFVPLHFSCSLSPFSGVAVSVKIFLSECPSHFWQPDTYGLLFTFPLETFAKPYSFSPVQFIVLALRSFYYTFSSVPSQVLNHFAHPPFTLLIIK